jgi:prepilin-type N-terminal cleavage/methylation domain-containing protein
MSVSLKNSCRGFTLLEVLLALALLSLFLTPALFQFANRSQTDEYNLKAIQGLKLGQQYFDQRILTATQKNDFTFAPSFEDGFYTLKIQWKDAVAQHEIVLKGKDF